MNKLTSIDQIFNNQYYKKSSWIYLLIPLSILLNLINILKYYLYEKESIKYSIFGGMIVSELNYNNLSELIKNLTKIINNNLIIYNRIVKVISYFKFNKSNEKGIVVTHLFPNSIINNKNIIKVGDIISKINNKTVNNINDYNNALNKPLIKNKVEYIKFETNDNSVLVIKLSDILEKEEDISKNYMFELGNVQKNLIKKFKSKKTQKNNNKKSKKINK